MKKIVSLIATAVLLLTMTVCAVPAQAADSVFENPKDINIVYLGGSITQGAGGKPCWVDLVSDYFKKTYGEDNVTNHNAGVGGTGSDYGLLRFKRDVVDKNPDMVFIEYAVNDGGADTTRYLESMVLTLQKLEKVPYICFVYTTNKALSVNQTYQRAVADYYGLAQIDFQERMKKEIEKNPSKKMEDFLNDSVHPNADGYAVYADEVITCLKSGKYFTKPLVKDKKYNSKSMFVNTTFTPAKSFVTTKGWQELGNYITTSDNTSAIGQKLHFEFTGNIFAVEHRLHFNGGTYKVTIDGKHMGNVSDYYKNIEGQLVLGYANFDLGQGKHTVDIEVVEQKDSGSGGHMVGFYNFITNENPDFDTTKVEQNFDDGDNSAIADIGATPKVEWEWDGTCGANGTGGLKVTTGTGTYGSGTGVPFNVDGLEIGRTYTMSAKIKLDSVETLKTDNVLFTFRLDGMNEDGTPSGKNAFVKAVAENVGLNNQEFVTATAEMVFTGEGVLSSNKTTLCGTDGTFEVRVGSDKLEEVTGDRNTALTYYIDDITMIPGEKAENSGAEVPAEIQILVNGVKVEADVPPVIVDDRTLVPVRAIFEALTATVEWIPETRTVQADRGADHIEIQIDNPVMLVNGVEVALDVPAQIIDDRTLVPARAVAESFNLNVDWDGATRTVIITNK